MLNFIIKRDETIEKSEILGYYRSNSILDEDDIKRLLRYSADRFGYDKTSLLFRDNAINSKNASFCIICERFCDYGFSPSDSYICLVNGYKIAKLDCVCDFKNSVKMLLNQTIINEVVSIDRIDKFDKDFITGSFTYSWSGGYYQDKFSIIRRYLKDIREIDHTDIAKFILLDND